MPLPPAHPGSVAETSALLPKDPGERLALLRLGTRRVSTPASSSGAVAAEAKIPTGLVCLT